MTKGHLRLRANLKNPPGRQMGLGDRQIFIFLTLSISGGAQRRPLHAVVMRHPCSTPHKEPLQQSAAFKQLSYDGSLVLSLE
jgi:hypothetical protein